MDIQKMVDKILDGYTINKEEALELYQEDTQELYEGAKQIRDAFFSDSIELCAIISGKSGHCSENCTFCAQSCLNREQSEVYDHLSSQEIVEDAKKREKEGILRYSIVTSGKKASPRDFKILKEHYDSLNKEVPIMLCASHGLLSKEQLQELKDLGVKRYHNNLETSRKYFPQICTSHTYDEKVQTICWAKEVGLEVCSGGIFGLGESREDRIDMLLTLRALDVESIPLNVLNPIEGTPLYELGVLEENEILKSMCVARFLLPDKPIRLAGGRGLFQDKGKRLLSGPINASISGDLLTTAGIQTEDDRIMISDIGYKVRKIE